MWTVVKVQATEVLKSVLDGWKAGIDAHEPDRVATLFADDAVFQGLHPYSIGQASVAAYYDGQPAGMTVGYEILESRSPTDDLIVGYVRASFAFVDRPTVPLNIGVVVTRGDEGWRILQYQASRVE
jgi:uncharacterized protein (TIGR02246 family)